MYFPNYRLLKMWLDQVLKRPVLRTPFDSEHVEGSQTVPKSK